MTADTTQHRSQDWRAVHGILLFGLIVVATFVPALRDWPMIWLGPLACYGVLVTIIPPLRATIWRWRFGNVSRLTLLATVVFSVGSSAALLTFHHLVRSDVSDYATFLPVSRLGGVLMTVILFSVANAFCEELIFRGVFLDALESQWGASGAWSPPVCFSGTGICTVIRRERSERCSLGFMECVWGGYG